jgi:hypothetical protein
MFKSSMMTKQAQLQALQQEYEGLNKEFEFVLGEEDKAGQLEELRSEKETLMYLPGSIDKISRTARRK